MRPRGSPSPLCLPLIPSAVPRWLRSSAARASKTPMGTVPDLSFTICADRGGTFYDVHSSFHDLENPNERMGLLLNSVRLFVIFEFTA